ncbi:high-affinity iron transporter [Arboricoccus pini]|uniref:High-affinity iron transporter n=1 Tax=Arboricoccus pini TaxID=1963835 RepID=A0A212RBR9_9PROT|nr:iron uptake transporter permease EfeU [Arboricoccus pini]SNB69662.1 high-affinity iron transporter [Arboricoccus pini]
MLVPFLIMLREGIEAALVVGIVASYLRQTGQERWMPAVWIGVVVAAILCLVFGMVLDVVSGEFPQREQELFEAAVGLIAVVILTWMVFWMRRAARSIRHEIHDAIDAALERHKTRNGQALALTLMAFFAVSREGLESVFFLLATFQQESGLAAPIGAFLGLTLAIGFGFGIYYGGVKLNLARFFRWTGIFILFVAAGLLAGSLRALHEAGLWNGLQSVAFDLSQVLPVDGALGTILAGIFGYEDTPTIGEVLVYVLFLVATLPPFLSQAAPRPVATDAGAH